MRRESSSSVDDGEPMTKFHGTVPAGLVSTVATSIRVRVTQAIPFNPCRSRLLQPAVSFAFDDFPRSALKQGGRMLRERGWRGTFYVAGCFCNRTVDGIEYFTPDDLLEAHHHGHELGCHTFGHLRLRSHSNRAIVGDLARNRIFIQNIIPGHQFQSFAYPYGDLDLRVKVLLARQFRISRGIWKGINRGWMDMAQLQTIELKPMSYKELEIDRWLDRAVAAKAWLIFFTHDVAEHPSAFGCSVDVFARIAASVAERGIRVLPVTEAAGLAGMPASIRRSDELEYRQ